MARQHGGAGADVPAVSAAPFLLDLGQGVADHAVAPGEDRAVGLDLVEAGPDRQSRGVGVNHAVAVSHLDPAHWFVGGPALQDQSKTSFFLDVLISDETNTAAEKARYIAAVHAAMQAALGELHEVSYIHVHEARQAAWGYGGLTQQFRAVRQQLQSA